MIPIKYRGELKISWEKCVWMKNRSQNGLVICMPFKNNFNRVFTQVPDDFGID